MAKRLETARVLICSVESQDEPVLQRWRGTADYRKFVFAGAKQRYHLQLLVVRKGDAEPLGVIYTFSHNERDGYLFLNVFIEERYRRLGYGAEACIVLICHLFDQMPLYKIYCDALAGNTASVAMMRGADFQQEALLRGHILYAGERHDVVRFAAYRDNLPHLQALWARLQNRKTR